MRLQMKPKPAMKPTPPAYPPPKRLRMDEEAKRLGMDDEDDTEEVMVEDETVEDEAVEDNKTGEDESVEDPTWGEWGPSSHSDLTSDFFGFLLICFSFQ